MTLYRISLVLLGVLSMTSSFVVPLIQQRRSAFIVPCTSHPLQRIAPTALCGLLPTDWVPRSKAEEQISKLVIDDELWGLAIGLGDIVRESIWECVTNFKFRPDQLALVVDTRIKKEIASMMGKESFHVLDFIIFLNKIAKDEVKEVARNEEINKMTNKIEKDVTSYLSVFTGKKNPDGKDIEDAIEAKARSRVAEFFGMEEFSLDNVAKKIDERRQQFWKDRLGDFWAARANDVNNMATRIITGKETYQFGDVTAKLASEMFGGGEKKK